MPFVQQVMPQFRDADPDGLIGLKGFMRSFQDIHTWYMHEIRRGNDTMPEEYGAAWVYTRYHIHMREKADYTDFLTLKAWMEPYHQPVLVNMDMTVTQHGHLIAAGKLESCVFSLTRQRPLRLTAVDFPENMPEVIEEDIPDFDRMDRSLDGMVECYQKRVRFSDLDKSCHMNNLRYLEMFEDAYDSALWQKMAPNDMEICFLSQCREGEELTVLGQEAEDGVRLAACHADGRTASLATFRKV